ncbi:uncharacterized protein B0H64DRAFT_411037 [Chaetomium fimeti]|uniref:Uncharacterized protein n=1 Tax=Chaetomium fimeti TaxID=1854472 RepID=A0AAE0H6N1_9PEZI|nr:hypothetical protein B0H64DRAFT_411037 [Chaetomium fimeti]
MPRRVTNRGRSRSTRGSHQLPLIDSLEGLIMWLPPREDLPRHAELPKGCYGHPVVILSPQASLPAHCVVVLIVTSLGETDVREKFPHDIEQRRAYLPIHPARNQDTRIQLRLQNGATMRKKSYANTRQQRTIPLDCLQPYDRNDATAQHVLTSDSYEKLARHAGFVFDAAEPSDNAHTPDPIADGDLIAGVIALLEHSTGPTDGFPSSRPATYHTLADRRRLSVPSSPSRSPSPARPAPPPPAPFPPSPPPGGYYNNTLIEHHHRQHTTTQPARQQIPPAPLPPQPNQPLLPRYHSRPPARYTCPSIGGLVSGVAWCLNEVTAHGVLLGLMALGLLWVCVRWGVELLGGAVWFAGGVIELAVGPGLDDEWLLA